MVGDRAAVLHGADNVVALNSVHMHILAAAQFPDDGIRRPGAGPHVQQRSRNDMRPGIINGELVIALSISELAHNPGIRFSLISQRQRRARHAKRTGQQNRQRAITDLFHAKPSILGYCLLDENFRYLDARGRKGDYAFFRSPEKKEHVTHRLLYTPSNLTFAVSQYPE